MIRKLKARFSECYRIRNGWGIYPIRTKRECKALYDFCKRQIEESNPSISREKRLSIYRKYMEIYDLDLEACPPYVYCDCGECLPTHPYQNAIEYAQDHAGWFWS